MSDRWRRIKGVFQAALELDAADRPAFLDDACADDEGIRSEVESLLASHDSAEEFLSQPPSGAAAQVVAAAEPDALTGQRLGPYRVLQRIGRGGTGAVYLAVRDDDEYRQRVAIKVVRRGMATADILQRFRVERQILASIDHPNIARLIDGGSTAEGLPYFVMEHIEGEPIDRYCDAQRLDVGERIELFRKVCAAVQVAHQNLVVHRDLKPGNILVTTDGIPKLLDFGIAKLLNPELSGGAHDPTLLEMRVMTPDFASPEQIRGGAITTASDVYSLGVLLFLLLSGHRPYRLGDKPVREMESAVTTGTVPRPSTVVGAAEEICLVDGTVHEVNPETVAAARSTTPERLRRQLAGDLDNIVGKALRKEPLRRYSSVEHLADDLARFTRGLPVEARPDTFGYRTGKFLRRHRLPAAITATAGIVGLGFAVALVVQSSRVADARDRAEEEAAKVHAVNDFLQGILGAADPLDGMGARVTVIEALEAAAPRIDQAFAGQPAVEAEARLTIGRTFLRLGRFDGAETQIRTALQLRRGLHAGDHPEIADTLNSLGEVRYDQGDMDGAESLYDASLAMLRRLHGTEHAAIASALDNLGNVQQERGRLDAAEGLYRESLAMRQRVIGAESREVASSLNNVASVLHDRGRLQEAERIYRESLDMTRRVLGSEHPDVASGLNNLALLLYDRGDLAAAEPLMRESTEMTRRLLGDRHPGLAQSLTNLAFLLQDRGDSVQAEELLLEAMEIIRAGPGESHPMTADVLEGLAAVREEAGDWQAASALYARELELRRASMPADSPDLALVIIDYGRSLGRLGRWEDAEPAMRNAFEVLRNAPGTDPRLVGMLAVEMAEMYEALGQPERAEEFRRLRSPDAPEALPEGPAGG